MLNGNNEMDVDRAILYNLVKIKKYIEYFFVMSILGLSTCAGFLSRAAIHMAEQGIRIERVMTDQAKNYTRSMPWRRPSSTSKPTT
jgi:hypothetical protein